MLGVVAGLAVCALAPRVAVASPESDEELRYIDALQRMRMPDIAEEVIVEARKRFPAAEFPEFALQLKVRESQGLLSQGKFEDVQKEIDKIANKTSPEYWAQFLAMADAYYAFSQYAEADKRYLEFFKKVEKPPAELTTFFRDSAYKYSMMLLAMGRDTDALAAYRHLFKIPLDESVLRKVQAEVAELLIKIAPAEQKKEAREAMLKEAEGLVDKLLWKQDIWFGKAIVMKAHISLLRGNLKGAQDMVENYMPQLKIIHESLLEEDPDGRFGLLQMSPMPQCRYLLAVLLLNEAEAEAKKTEGVDEERIKDLLLGKRDPQTRKREQNGAFQHFINVFMRFSESQWAADAGERAERIRKLVKARYDADIGVPVTEEQMAKVRQKQFSGVQQLFSQNQFKEAVERYLVVLNQFPESLESVSGLGDLAASYIELSEKDPDAALMADMVVGHLSERFCAKPNLMRDAGDQLRRIGEYYGERKMEDKRREVYAIFFRDYPEHYAAGQLIMSFGEREFQAGNFPGAKMYYTQVAEVYTQSPHYFDALSRLAQIEREEGSHTGEIAALALYVEKLAAQNKPSHALVSGKFRLATAQREYGNALLKGTASAAEAGAEAGAEAAEAQEPSATAQADAAAWLVKAVAGLTDVIKCLTDAPNDYQMNADEKQRNDKIKELAVFSRAVCFAQMQHPPDKVSEFRKTSIAAFEDYVKLYPKGDYAPRAQLQIGTLHTILQNVEEAQKALDKLNKEHPGSDEAKNSVPMLAASLIEMGLRAEGIARYRQMFASGVTYTEGQYMAAAKALEEAREYDLALVGYDKAMSLTKDAAMTAVAKLGRARTLAAQKRYTDSRKLLNEFIKEYAKSQLMVEANYLLVDVASEEGMVEKNDKERTLLFNMAVDALRVVRRQGEGKPELQKELDLKTGEVYIRQMEADKKLGRNPAESRGKAIVALDNIAQDPENIRFPVVLEKAFFYVIPLMLEHKANVEVIEGGENYLRLFPAGRYRTDVQNWINQAKIGM